MDIEKLLGKHVHIRCEGRGGGKTTLYIDSVTSVWEEIIKDIIKREEAAIMGTSAKCETCGHVRIRPHVGTMLRNTYKKCLGVVTESGITTQPDMVRVNVVSGTWAGTSQNWYLRNVERVHGHFHITKRTAL